MPPISTSQTRKSRRRESSKRELVANTCPIRSYWHSPRRVLSLGAEPGNGMRRMNQTARQTARAQSLPATQQALPAAQVSDIAVALATARVVRAIPMVADLSRGRGALVATYGLSPDQRVIGVVIHHPSPNTRRIQVHVVLSEAMSTRMPPMQMVEGHSVLGNIAEQIRVAVYQAVQDMDWVVLVGVDVLIDDLR